MRFRLAGLLALAFVVVSTTSVPASIVQTTIFPATVPWQFSTATNTFSGEQVVGPLPNGLVATVSLHALFDDLGNFQSGTFEMRRLSDNALALAGDVTGHGGTVDHGEHFRTVFDLDFTFASPFLGFPAQFGFWETYVCDGADEGFDCADGPTSVAGVFTSDYTNARYPVFNYIRTFAEVPSPTPFALIGAGMALLASLRASQALRRRAE